MWKIIVQPDRAQMVTYYSVKNEICVRDYSGKNTETHLLCSMFIILNSITKYFQLDSSAKGTQFCISVLRVNIFVLLTAICTPTITKSERIVAFTWQQ
jgi:hypothetical protein